VIKSSSGTIDDKWEKEPYIIVGIPNEDILVYKLKKKAGKGKENTLDRNLLLPLMSIPYTDDETQSEKPKARPEKREQTIHTGVVPEQECRLQHRK
jgi:hypothetical protein